MSNSTELSRQQKFLEDINNMLEARAAITDSEVNANKNLVEQIKIQKEIYDDINQSTQDQKTALDRMVAAQDQLVRNLENRKNLLKTTDKIFFSLNKSALSFDKFFGKLKLKMKPLTKGIDKLKKGAEKVGEAISKGLGKALSKTGKFLLNLFDKIMSHPIVKAVALTIQLLTKLAAVMTTVFTGGLKYVTRFTKFMVSLPMKIAGAAAKIGNSLRQDLVMVIGQAVENTKEMFDISEQYGSGAGSAIKSFADSASASMLEFRDITSDSVKLFGQGAQGIQARTQAMAQRLGEMGSYADILGESLRASTDGSAEQFTFMEKSLRILGMTAEDVAYTAQEAAKSGVGINKILMDTQISLKNVAKSSGVNSKLISKNFNVLRKDIINFGHMSTKQLQETSAELVKMGLSAQDAASMFGKLDTFESAAQMSAMLSQSFGMNLDALKLIKAENPQEIFEDLRDSMMSTGRSFDDMNRHEKSLMASTTGLSGASLKALMDFRDMGMSYEEAMQKMKENSPEEKQLKAFDSMVGSLKEIKNIIQDTSFFSSFFKGLRSSIVLASGLGDKFQLVSKRIEEFYLEGINFGKDKALMKSFSSAFKPISDTLEELVGDPKKGTKGLFDTAVLSSAVKPWIKKFSNTLGDVFAGKKSLKTISGEFSNTLRNAFDFKTFLSSNKNPATTLFKTGGKLVGQLLKSFAAFGPGLIEVFSNAFTGIVNIITGQGTLFGGSVIHEKLMELFGLNKDDQAALMETFNLLVDKIIGSGGPLMRLIYWFNKEAVKLISKAMLGIGSAIFDSLFGYNSYLYQAVKAWALTNPVGQLFRLLGFVGDIGFFKTQEGIFEQSMKKNVGATLNSLDLTSMASDNFDEKQAEDVGKLYAALKKEEKVATGKTLKGIQNLIKKIDDQIGNHDFNSLRSDKVIKDIVDSAAKIRGDKRMPSVVVAQANDYITDTMAPTGKSIVQKTARGLSVTNLNKKDQVLAGMEGGPIVDAIKYSGESVGAIMDYFSKQFVAMGQVVGSNNTEQRINQPIKIDFIMDGEKMASKLVAADIIGMAKNPAVARGATVLNDGSTRNQSGGSNEISALG